jgi:hypothetical protein
MSKSEIYKATCPTCEGDRKCDVVGSVIRSHNEGYNYREEWRLLTCRGCETVFFGTRTLDFEEMNFSRNVITGEEEWEPQTNERYWPSLSKRKAPDWLAVLALPDEVETALRETYGAIDADLPMLAAVGARACLDAATIALGADPADDLAVKVKELVKNKLLTEEEGTSLGYISEAGGASVHRGWRPTKAQLDHAMDILESFLNERLIKPEETKKRAADTAKHIAKIPKRPKRQKPSK